MEIWRPMEFDKDDLIDSRIRLSVANKGVLRDLDRTPIIASSLGERNLWMSFLVSDQFFLGRDFISNFDVTTDLNNAKFRIRNPERKYVKKRVKLIIEQECKASLFLSRRVRLKIKAASLVSLKLKSYIELSDNNPK